MIKEDIRCVQEYYIVLFFILLPEVLLEASIVQAWNIMLFVLIDINDHMLQTAVEELFDLLGHLRVQSLGRLDNHLKLPFEEVNLGLGGIYS